MEQTYETTIEDRQHYPVTDQIYVRTPLVESVALRKHAAGRRVFMKLENTQPSGSFKLRGISALCKFAKERGFTELVTSSGGNAGAAVAYTAQQLGLACHVVVMRNADKNIVEIIRSYGATVEMCGDAYEETHAQAVNRVRTGKGSYLVHPFDNSVLWRGHSTIIDELVEDLGHASGCPSLIVTCCGGGGLICGLVYGLRKHGWQSQTKILAMETRGCDSLNAVAVSGGDRAKLAEITSEVPCLAAKEVCEQMINHFNESRPPILSRVVEDRDAFEGCVRFANQHRFLVSTACGTTMSAFYTGLVASVIENNEAMHNTIYDKYNHTDDFSHNTNGPVVAIICGGCDVTLDSMLKLKELTGL